MGIYIPLEVDEYKKRFKDGGEDHILVDVRTPEEFEEIRIPGAVLMPLDELVDYVDDLPRDKPIVVVCRTGVRSITGAQMLRYYGIEGEVFNLEGGTRSWAMKKYPVESGVEE